MHVKDVGYGGQVVVAAELFGQDLHQMDYHGTFVASVSPSSSYYNAHSIFIVVHQIITASVA